MGQIWAPAGCEKIHFRGPSVKLPSSFRQICDIFPQFLEKVAPRFSIARGEEEGKKKDKKSRDNNNTRARERERT